jgi:hypothetical protein
MGGQTLNHYLSPTFGDTMNDLHAFDIIDQQGRTIGYLSMQASFADVRKLIYAGYLVMPHREN